MTVTRKIATVAMSAVERTERTEAEIVTALYKGIKLLKEKEDEAA